jgi:hypothetical protein
MCDSASVVFVVFLRKLVSQSLPFCDRQTWTACTPKLSLVCVHLHSNLVSRTNPGTSGSPLSLQITRCSSDVERSRLTFLSCACLAVWPSRAPSYGPRNERRHLDEAHRARLTTVKPRQVTAGRLQAPAVPISPTRATPVSSAPVPPSASPPRSAAVSTRQTERIHPAEN